MITVRTLWLTPRSRMVTSLASRRLGVRYVEVCHNDPDLCLSVQFEGAIALLSVALAEEVFWITPVTTLAVSSECQEWMVITFFGPLPDPPSATPLAKPKSTNDSTSAKHSATSNRSSKIANLQNRPSLRSAQATPEAKADPLPSRPPQHRTLPSRRRWPLSQRSNRRRCRAAEENVFPGSPGSRPNKPFTKAGTRIGVQQNKDANGGVAKCILCGEKVVPPTQSKPRVPTNPREWRGDHDSPMSRGGSGDPSNFNLLCSPCNLLKSNMTWAELFNKLGGFPNAGIPW